MQWPGVWHGEQADRGVVCFFFFSSRRRHTRLQGDWSSDVCSSDLAQRDLVPAGHVRRVADQAGAVVERADRAEAEAEHGEAVRELERRGADGFDGLDRKSVV